MARYWTCDFSYVSVCVGGVVVLSFSDERV